MIGLTYLTQMRVQYYAHRHCLNLPPTRLHAYTLCTRYVRL